MAPTATTAPPEADPARVALHRVRKATRLAVSARAGGITARQLADRQDLRDAVLAFTVRRGSMYRHIALADVADATWPSASQATWNQAIVILRTLEEIG